MDIQYNMILSNLVHLNLQSESSYSYVQWKQLKQEIAIGISPITVQDRQLYLTYMLLAIISHFKLKIKCMDNLQQDRLQSRSLFLNQPYGCFYLIKATSSVRKGLDLDSLPINNVKIMVPQTLIVNLTFLEFNTLYTECNCCRSALQIHGLWPSKESITSICNSGDTPLISPYLLSKINVVGLITVESFTELDTILVSFNSRTPVKLMHTTIGMMHYFYYYYNYEFNIEKGGEQVKTSTRKPKLEVADASNSGWWIRITLISHTKFTFKLNLKPNITQQDVFDGPGGLSPKLKPTEVDGNQALFAATFNTIMLLEIGTGQEHMINVSKLKERHDNTAHCLPAHRDANKVYTLEAGQSQHL